MAVARRVLPPLYSTTRSIQFSLFKAGRTENQITGILGFVWIIWLHFMSGLTTVAIGSKSSVTFFQENLHIKNPGVQLGTAWFLASTVFTGLVGEPSILLHKKVKSGRVILIRSRKPLCTHPYWSLAVGTLREPCGG